MTGLVAPELSARDVRMVGCHLVEAWLRSATVRRCELKGCDLTRADLYAAKLEDTRLVDSLLDETEWSKATLANVALHGSSLEGIRGVDAFRQVVIASDQLLPLAIPMLASLGVVIDDDYLDATPARSGH